MDSPRGPSGACRGCPARGSRGCGPEPDPPGRRRGRQPPGTALPRLDRPRAAGRGGIRGCGTGKGLGKGGGSAGAGPGRGAGFPARRRALPAEAVQPAFMMKRPRAERLRQRSDGPLDVIASELVRRAGALGSSGASGRSRPANGELEQILGDAGGATVKRTNIQDPARSLLILGLGMACGGRVHLWSLGSGQ